MEESEKRQKIRMTRHLNCRMLKKEEYIQAKFHWSRSTDWPWTVRVMMRRKRKMEEVTSLRRNQWSLRRWSSLARTVMVTLLQRRELKGVITRRKKYDE